MRIQGMKSGYTFSGNPIRYEMEAVAGIKGGSFRVMMGDPGKEIYHGKFSLPFSLNVSDIVDAELLQESSLYVSRSEWLFRHSGLQEMMMTVEYDNGADWESLPVKVLKGKLPDKLYSRMIGSNSDYFTERFLNPKANFFFTTRTDTNLIEIPETELYPLRLIVPEGKRLKAVMDGREVVTPPLSEGLYNLSVENLRRLTYESDCRTIPSVFKIGFADAESFVTIVITRSEIVSDLIRLRYVNTFGVPEVMAFGGTLTIKPEPSGKESESYMAYNSITDGYSTGKGREDYGLTLSLDTGPVSPEQLPRLVELLESGNVVLEIADFPESVDAIVTADNFSFPLHPEEPVNYTLTLRLKSPDKEILKYLSPDRREPWRIFSMEHNDKFN